MPSGTKPSGLTAFSGAIDRTNDLALIWDNSASLLKKAAWGSVFPVISITDYGAVGNDSTDCTTAIQAALDASTAEAPKCIYIPAGVYKITDKLVFPGSPGTKVMGDGRWASVIKQYTAGKPVFEFNTSDTHTITFEDFSADYNAAQTNAASKAFYYNATDAGTLSFYHHQYNRIGVRYAYDAFALQTTGSQTIWDSHWNGIFLSGIYRSGWYFAQETPAGQPSLSWQNIMVNNVSPAVSSIGYCWNLTACEARFDNLDVEGWQNEVIGATGGGWLQARGIHVESHVFSAASSYLFYAANSASSFRGVSIAGASGAACEVLNLFRRGDTNVLMELYDVYHNVDTSASAGIYLQEVSWSNTATSYLRGCIMSGIVKGGGNINQPLTGTRAAESTPLIQIGPLTDGSETFGIYTPRVVLQGGQVLIANQATPEGAVTAGIGALCVANVAGTGKVFVKASGTGNTGWVELAKVA